ncbi:hypothetical protein ACFQY8_00065 [Alloscardovia venturai]|uniref:Ig-like domain-containing protein n=2 Tax=Alloscardovia venturai TaxID=1769421 RepID=A0ABW2Y1L9_9BIFI
MLSGTRAAYADEPSFTHDTLIKNSAGVSLTDTHAVLMRSIVINDDTDAHYSHKEAGKGNHSTVNPTDDITYYVNEDATFTFQWNDSSQIKNAYYSADGGGTYYQFDPKKQSFTDSHPSAVDQASFKFLIQYTDDAHMTEFTMDQVTTADTSTEQSHQIPWVIIPGKSKPALIVNDDWDNPIDLTKSSATLNEKVSKLYLTADRDYTQRFRAEIAYLANHGIDGQELIHIKDSSIGINNTVDVTGSEPDRTYTDYSFVADALNQKVGVGITLDKSFAIEYGRFLRGRMDAFPHDNRTTIVKNTLNTAQVDSIVAKLNGTAGDTHVMDNKSKAYAGNVDTTTFTLTLKVKKTNATTGQDELSPTSNVAVTLQFPDGKRPGDSGAPYTPARSVVTSKSDKNGHITFSFPGKGVYDFDKVQVNFHRPNVNAMQSESLGNLLKQGYAADSSENPLAGVKTIAIMPSASEMQKEIKAPEIVLQDNGEHLMNDKNFSKTDASVMITIHDEWFMFYKFQKRSVINDFVKLTGADGKKIALDSTKLDKLVDAEDTSLWRAQTDADTGNVYYRLVNPVKLSSLLPQHRSELAEDKYTVDVNYLSKSSTPHVTFGIDRTPAQIRSITVDTVEKDGKVAPITSLDGHKWLVSNKTIRVTLGNLYDKISGTDAQHITVKYAGEGGDTAYTVTPDDSGKAYVITLAHPSEQFDLSQFTVTIKDKADNESEPVALNALKASAKDDVSGIDLLVTDADAPHIHVYYDNDKVKNDKYFNAAQTGHIEVTEANLNLLQQAYGDDAHHAVAELTVDGKVTQTITVDQLKKDNSKPNVWNASFATNADGNWNLDTHLTDIAGNTATIDEYQKDFVVDTIAPVLSYSWDKTDAAHGMYFNHGRLLTVTQVERNFSQEDTKVSSTWRSDSHSPQVSGPQGGLWSAPNDTYSYSTTIHFTSDGRYTAKITAMDLAGNVAEKTIDIPEFVIDTTKPDIQFDNVKDKTAYKDKVSPSILVSDADIDGTKTTYKLTATRLKDASKAVDVSSKETDMSRTFTFSDFKHKVENDDVYTLQVQATDLAGNTFSKTITFSVNRYGSTYKLSGSTAALRGKFVKSSGNIVVDEINVSGLQMDQSKVLVAHGEDSQILNTQQYSAVESDDKGWSRTRYTIPERNFREDGYYRVILSSKDKAGNVNENTMDKKDSTRTKAVNINFAVDNTSPAVKAIGAKSHAVYYSAHGRTVTVQAQDNLKLDTVTLKVDGKRIGEWTGDELNAKVRSYKLDSDAKDHDITLTAVDEAGNKTVASYSQMVVATNWWQYMKEHAVMTLIFMFTSLLSLLVLIVVAVTLVIRHRQLKYRRNPFEQ